MTVTITEENFRREVLREPKPVLLEFYGVWCSKCAMMEDVLTEFTEDHDGEIKVCRADIDKNEQLAVRFGVDTVPAFFAFRGGKAVGAVVGIVPKRVLEELF